MKKVVENHLDYDKEFAEKFTERWFPSYDRPNTYDFYKTADGVDCLEKTYYYTKYGGITGAVFSFYEAVLVSKPNSVSGTLGRFYRFTFPMAAMGFVFGSSVCMLGQLRKENDTINHGIAGALAGTVWGFKYNSVRIGHIWAVFLGLTAAYFKFFHVHNIPMFNRAPEYRRQNRSGLHWHVPMFDDPGRPNEA